MKASSLIKNGLLLLSTLLVCLGLMELGVRLLFPEFRPPEEHPFFVSTVAGVTLGPAGRRFDFITSDFRTVVEFNKYGFRDRRDLTRADPGDLFVVGDSFSVGHGISEVHRYSDVLESLIGTRVYNVSIPSEIQHYWRLVRYAELVGAPIRRLIVGVCMENDILRYELPVESNLAWSADAEAVMAEIADAEPPALDLTTLLGWKLFVAKQTAFYGVFVAAVKNQRWLTEKLVGFGLIGNFDFSVDGDEFAVASSLAMIQPFIERYETTILIIPSRALWIGPMKRRMMASKTHESFIRGLEALGAEVVDPRPSMEAEGNPLGYHFVHDGHWNEQGHRLAAQLLARHLQ